jgi:hypothetical protein
VPYNDILRVIQVYKHNDTAYTIPYYFIRVICISIFHIKFDKRLLVVIYFLGRYGLDDWLKVRRSERCFACIKHREFIPLLASGRPNRCRVFLEATATPSDLTPEELLTDPIIKGDRLGDLVGVNVERFVDVPGVVVSNIQPTQACER